MTENVSPKSNKLETLNPTPMLFTIDRDYGKLSPLSLDKNPGMSGILL